MFAAFDAVVGVAYHLVCTLARLLNPLAGGLATAAAIVAFTMAVRLLLLPLSYRALRGQASQARLLPQIAERRQRHAGQPERLQRELTALYQREGSGLLAGCLPLLLQLPFFSLLYRLFRSPSINGHPNDLLGHSLFGAPLGMHWLAGAGPLSAQGLVFAGLFALLAVVGWVAARVARLARPAMAPVTEPAAGAARTGAGRTGPGGTGAGRTGPSRTGPNPGTAAAGAAAPAGASRFVSAVLPYSTVLIAAFVPLAAGLYLLTSTAWTTAERWLLRRRITPVSAPPGAGGMPERRRSV
jgi:YidC/Oxa1 family membrane protein insertase